MNFNRTNAQDFLGEMSPAGQRVQQALSPYQQFRVSGSVTPPAQDVGFSDPLGAFEELDPADDSFLEKQSVIFQSAPPELFRSPSVQNRIRQANAAHAEAQTYFKEDPTLVDFYIEQRGQNIPPSVALGELRKRAQDNSLKGAFLKAGGLVDEYETLRDPTTGQVDRFKMLDYVNRREREASVKKANAPKELPAEAYSRIDKARSDVENLMAISSDPAKLAAYYEDKTKKKMNSGKTDNIDEAWRMINEELKAAKDVNDRTLRSYSRQYSVPPELGGEAPVEPQWMDGPNLLQQNAQPESIQSNAAVPATVAPPTAAAPAKEPVTSWLERNKKKL
jgi:hypothetical protein